MKLARKAAAIDPENPAAERMVARLEEILEYRDASALLEAESAAEAVAVAEPEADVEPEAGRA